jgi:hypothetical protein
MRVPHLLLFVAAVIPGFAAGPLIVGVRSGVPLSTQDSLTGSFSDSKRFLIGPTLGVKLPLGFSVEGDALFRREKLLPVRIFDFGANFDSWEFPVMFKYSPGRIIIPVFGAGVTVRHVRDFGGVPGFLFGNSGSSNTVGFVAGAGLGFQVGPARITPEFRYTRWGGDTFLRSFSGLFPLSRNQGSFLVGVTF